MLLLEFVACRLSLVACHVVASRMWPVALVVCGLSLVASHRSKPLVASRLSVSFVDCLSKELTYQMTLPDRKRFLLCSNRLLATVFDCVVMR
eukprot:3460049-Amphidinium_carterae.1